MSATIIEGIPKLVDAVVSHGLSLRTLNGIAFVRARHFIARINLLTATAEWVFERSPEKLADDIVRGPRRTSVWGNDTWVGENGRVLSTIDIKEDGSLRIIAIDVDSGKQLWERAFPIPDAADWAENVPAYPGAQTEEIVAFLADDQSSLVLCWFRQSRQSAAYDHENKQFLKLPPYQCQTDAVRLEPWSGRVVWTASHLGAYVGVMERYAFKGFWSDGGQMGVIDLKTGANSVLYESENELGWPICDDLQYAIPWHSKNQVGVDWLSNKGQRIRQGVWAVPRVRSTQLHLTESGLALQANDQLLWWLGNSNKPIWRVRAKPYVYRVHSCLQTNVFVGTDGNGGRLTAFDSETGEQTLDLKPERGGVGNLTRVPSSQHLVSSFTVSRSGTSSSRLLILSMPDLKYNANHECAELVGVWQRGAICRIGMHGEQLSIVGTYNT